MKQEYKPENVIIGERLREVLVNKFGKLKLAADALIMPQQALNNYLKGRSAPGYEIRKRLVELGMDVEYIMTGREKGEHVQMPAAEYDRDILLVEIMARVAALERRVSELEGKK